MGFFTLLTFAAILGCIPAAIAQSKGRPFWGWWVYGALIFVVALIHSLVIKDERPKLARVAAGVSEADELVKFAKLRDDGLITEAEYQAKRQALLGVQPIQVEAPITNIDGVRLR